MHVGQLTVTTGVLGTGQNGPVTVGVVVLTGVVGDTVLTGTVGLVEATGMVTVGVGDFVGVSVGVLVGVIVGVTVGGFCSAQFIIKYTYFSVPFELEMFIVV